MLVYRKNPPKKFLVLKLNIMLTYMDKELGCSWWLLWRVSSVSASVMGQLEVCIYGCLVHL